MGLVVASRDDKNRDFFEKNQKKIIKNHKNHDFFRFNQRFNRTKKSGTINALNPGISLLIILICINRR